MACKIPDAPETAWFGKNTRGDPMNAQNWQGLLSDALNSGDSEKMQQALEHVPKQHLQMTIEAIKDQAHSHYRSGKHAEALEAYTQVMSLGTKDYFVLFHRTDCLFQLERFDDAFEAAVQLAEIHPEYHKVHRLLGAICLQRKDKANALEAFKKASELDKNDKKLAELVTSLGKEMKEQEDVLNRVFNPEDAENAEAPELPPLPELAFDPSVWHQDKGPEVNENMLRGLTTFLGSFADLEAPRELIARVEDANWLPAWEKALKQSKGKRVAVWGPEAGILPLLAKDAGAEGIVAWDPQAMTRRLMEGNIQKSLVGLLQEEHGDAWADMPKEDRSEQFEKISKPFDLLQKAPDELDGDVPEPCDVVAITSMDHTLLGRGFAAAWEACKKHLVTQETTLLPSRARFYATAIQWDYRCNNMDFSGLDPYHWSPYPLQVTKESGTWRSLTEPTLVAECDMRSLPTEKKVLNLPVIQDGTVHGILFWYQLEMGEASIDTGPEGNSPWVGQAYQYLDNAGVKSGETLDVALDLNPERILFHRKGPAEKKAGSLPLWHVHGVEDSPLHKAFVSSVERAIQTKGIKSVLNIGAGTGLLAMAAARAGATVYACEQSEYLCTALRNNLKANGLDDKVTVICEDPRQLTIPEHLPEKVEMVLFDKFDCGLLGDGIIHYLEHVLANLTVEDAVVLPKAGKLDTMLIERRISQFNAHDISLLTPYLFTPDYTHVHLHRIAHRVLSEPTEVLSFDFSKAAVAEEESTFEFSTSDDGIVGAVAFWYTLELDDETTITTSPLVSHPERGQALQYLPEIKVEANEKLGMKVKHTGSNVMFAIDPEGIDKERILQLPRFDPNWLNGHRNVMYQSGQIMQQLRMNPEEYERAFHLAEHFAAHPHRYGLTPSVAARFLFTFLGG